MSTVIKAAGPMRAAEGGAFNFDDVGLRANQYLEGVRRQAIEILTQAQQDAVEIRRAAQDQGRTDAIAAATKILDEKVTKQLTTLLPALKETVSQIQSAHSQWLLHWEKSAVHVAAAIAGRVVRRELARDPQITLNYVREALELASGGGDVHVRLHPDDHAALGAHAQQLVAQMSQLGAVQFVADPAITRGGCRVDTRFGSIDQQLEAQLNRIEEELT